MNRDNKFRQVIEDFFTSPPRAVASPGVHIITVVCGYHEWSNGHAKKKSLIYPSEQTGKSRW